MSILRTPSTVLMRLLMVAGTLATATPATADVVTDWNAKTVGYVNAAAGPRPRGFSTSRWCTSRCTMPSRPTSIASRRTPSRSSARRVRRWPPRPRRRATCWSVGSPRKSATIQARVPGLSGRQGLLVSDPGVAVGQEAALRVIALRNNDGAFPPNPEVFIGGTEPGQWRPTQPTFQQPMSAPWMGEVTPFALKDVDGLLHEPGPPHLSSGLYARDYDEVKALGARFGQFQDCGADQPRHVLLRELLRADERHRQVGGAGATVGHR